MNPRASDPPYRARVLPRSRPRKVVRTSLKSSKWHQWFNCNLRTYENTFCTQGKQNNDLIQQFLNLCSEDEWMSYRFGTTWGWVIFIFGWTKPLNVQTCFKLHLWINLFFFCHLFSCLTTSVISSLHQFEERNLFSRRGVFLAAGHHSYGICVLWEAGPTGASQQAEQVAGGGRVHPTRRQDQQRPEETRG